MSVSITPWWPSKYDRTDLRRLITLSAAARLLVKSSLPLMSDITSIARETVNATFPIVNELMQADSPTAYLKPAKLAIDWAYGGASTGEYYPAGTVGFVVGPGTWTFDCQHDIGLGTFGSEIPTKPPLPTGTTSHAYVNVLENPTGRVLWHECEIASAVPWDTQGLAVTPAEKVSYEAGDCTSIPFDVWHDIPNIVHRAMIPKAVVSHTATTETSHQPSNYRYGVRASSNFRSFVTSGFKFIFPSFRESSGFLKNFASLVQEIAPVNSLSWTLQRILLDVKRSPLIPGILPVNRSVQPVAPPVPIYPSPYDEQPATRPQFIELPLLLPPVTPRPRAPPRG